MPHTARRPIIAIVLSFCAMVATALATPAGAATAPAQPRQQAPGSPVEQPTAPPPTAGAIPQNCPNRDVPPPPIDASEQPAPGGRPLAPLPVPDQPVGGPRMAECGLVLPVGARKAPPNTQFGSWVLADLDSGAVLAAKDPHGRQRPASLAKVLLGLAVLRELKPDMAVTAIQEDANQEGTRVGLVPGVQYSVDQLLHTLLMASGNDSAHALARQLGGLPRALGKMNALAKQLGAGDTRVATPSGLDGPGMSSSAYDMAVIFRIAMQNPAFAEAVGARRIDLPGAPGKPPFAVYNDNPLLTAYPGDLGGKTGFTDDARHTYVNAAQHGQDRLVLVGLRGEMSPVSQLYTQARPLLDYAFELKAANSPPVGQLVDKGVEESGLNTGRGASGNAAATASGSSTRSAFGNVGGPLTAVAGVFLVLVLIMWWRRRRARLARLANAERHTESIPAQTPTP